MNRMLLLVVVGTLAALLTMGIVVGSVGGIPEAAAKKEFTLKSIEGTYGIVGNQFFPNGTHWLVFVGNFTFDGFGGCSISGPINTGTGAVFISSASCSYTVNPDGTGTMTTPGFSNAIVIVHAGDEILVINSTPGWAFSGVAHRQHR